MKDFIQLFFAGLTPFILGILVFLSGYQISSDLKYIRSLGLFSVLFGLFCWVLIIYKILI